MDLFSMERETSRQRAPQPPQALEGMLSAAVAAHFEFPIRRDPNLDLIAFLEFQRVDHGGGKSHRQAVTPLCDLHVPAPGASFTSP
jgi:hypothetical protein